jgi:rhamnosyltransferase
MNFAVIVPTLNASAGWPVFAGALLGCVGADRVLIVDSASTDGTADLARRANFQVAEISRSEFNHGGTRQWAAALVPDAEILIYLTQDAILADRDAIANLLLTFDDPEVGATCGRQLPRHEADPIEVHARLFNYPAESNVRSLEARERLGIKSIFISNSFAAYRRRAFEAVGGFPTDVIFGEDTVLAGKLLLNGWKVAYAGNACVYHSHSYTVVEEFRRYFDIGVLHTRESWLLQEFGRANGEGKRFVLSELKYLLRTDASLIPLALTRTAAKLAAYRLGKMERVLYNPVKRRLSMHRHFWDQAS